MRKIGIYLRSFSQSVKEKPLVFAIFVITIILCVVVSGTFYRLTKRQIEEFDELTYYTLSNGDELFDSVTLHDSMHKTNIKNVRDQLNTFKKVVNEEGASVDASISVFREYVGTKYFNIDELNQNERIAVVSLEYAKWFGIEVGDKIVIGDEDFKVIRKTGNHTERSVFIPAGCKTNYDSSYKQQNITLGCLGKMNAKTNELMTARGMTVERIDKFSVTVLATIILSVGVVALTAVNIFMCFRFIIKKNSRRYTLFRTMGAKGYDVAIMMTLESLIVTSIAFVIGMFIDYGITYGLTPDYMSKLKALDYLFLFLINISTVFLTTIVLIIKKIKAQPQDAMQRVA